MKLKPVKLTRDIKFTIDKEIYDWFCTKEVSLYTFRYHNSDEGYILLAPSKKTKLNFTSYIINMLTSLFAPNFNEVSKIKKAFSAETYSITKFDGFIPSNVLLNQLPITYKPNARSIINYVLAGYSEPINPNLISSWGYEAVY